MFPKTHPPLQATPDPLATAKALARSRAQHRLGNVPSLGVVKEMMLWPHCRILLCNKKEELGGFQGHYATWEEPISIQSHPVWFHVCNIPEVTKLRDGEVSWLQGYVGGKSGHNCKGLHRANVCGDKIVLYLDGSAAYMSLHMIK